MKVPICEACVNSALLCPGCQKSLEDGLISETDVELSRTLRKLEAKENIKEPSFEKTVVMDNMILVLTAGKVGNLIGKGGRIVRILSREMGKKVRIISAADFKTAIQDLVAPARVAGINIVYKPEGEATKVVLVKEDEHKLIAPLKSLETAANILAGPDKQVIFEVE